MDDELKAIQDDLDSVLERLASYMSSDKLFTQGIEWGEASKTDAATVILNYAGNDGTSYPYMHLKSVIGSFRCDRAFQNSERNKQTAFYGEKVGKVIAAIKALSDRRFVPDNHDLGILSNAANDFMEGRSKWFGESLGVPTVRTLRKKEGEMAKPPLVINGYLDPLSFEKKFAAMDVFYLHKEKKVPLDEGIFELVGERAGIKPGTLKAFYYSDEAKKMREMDEFISGIYGEK